jgi:hypothetical protein
VLHAAILALAGHRVNCGINAREVVKQDSKSDDLWRRGLGVTERLPLSRATNNAPFVAVLNGKDIISQPTLPNFKN